LFLSLAADLLFWAETEIGLMKDACPTKMKKNKNVENDW